MKKQLTTIINMKEKVMEIEKFTMPHFFYLIHKSVVYILSLGYWTTFFLLIIQFSLTHTTAKQLSFYELLNSFPRCLSHVSVLIPVVV